MAMKKSLRRRAQYFDQLKREKLHDRGNANTIALDITPNKVR